MAKRKKKTAKSRPAPVSLWAQVIVKLSNKGNSHKALGTVTMYDPQTNQVVVEIEGEEIVVDLRDVEVVDDYSDITASSPVHEDQPGFHQYPIEWWNSKGEILIFDKTHNHDPSHAIRFRTHVEGVKFYGSWRRTISVRDHKCFAIDLYAHWDNNLYTLPPMFYDDYDPRLPGTREESTGDNQDDLSSYSGIRELNSDICLAINRWLYFHSGGNVQTLSDLRCQADNPTLRFTTFDSLRTAIIQLTDLYNKSAVNGGFRSVFIEGSTKSHPPVRVETELTSNLMAKIVDEEKGFRLEPVPDPPEPLGDDDRAVAKTNRTITAKRGRPRQTDHNIPTTLKELEEAKAEIQKTPKRDRSHEEIAREKKIRAAIRQLTKRP